MISDTHTNTESTYCQALLYKQRLQKLQNAPALTTIHEQGQPPGVLGVPKKFFFICNNLKIC